MYQLDDGFEMEMECDHVGFVVFLKVVVLWIGRNFNIFVFFLRRDKLFRSNETNKKISVFFLEI